MALTVSKVDVWAADIRDRAGGLAGTLGPLAAAGANFEFIIARRRPEARGHGVVFVTPLKGAKQLRTAKAVGFKKTDTMHSVRVEGPDRPGLAAVLTNALAEAGINVRGFSAAAIGRKCVVHLALDTAADARKAMTRLRKV